MCFSAAVSKSSSSGIISTMPVRLANKSPWFLYPRIAGTARGVEFDFVAVHFDKVYRGVFCDEGAEGRLLLLTIPRTELLVFVKACERGTYLWVIDIDNDDCFPTDLFNGVEVSEGIDLVQTSKYPHARTRPPIPHRLARL